MSRALAIAALLVVSSASCSGSPTRDDGLAELFEAEGPRAARTRAPDMLGAADRAREDAESARRRGDADAAADHATRARLLLTAAVAESERIALEERRLAIEARIEELDAQAARDAVATREIEAEVERLLASRLAQREARRMFEIASEDEPRRFRRVEDDRAQMHREAAAFLRTRASLLLAAAEALGAEPASLIPARERVEEAGRVRDVTEQVTAAQDAFRAAQALLGAARARSEGPDADQRAALVRDAGEQGFEVEQVDRGLVVVVDGVFRGRGAQVEAASARRIAALLSAHPHGPVRVEVMGERRAAAARAEALERALVAAGVPEARVGADPVAGEPRVALVFVAYAAQHGP